MAEAVDAAVCDRRIALVVVLAGLGAYIYFVTWKTAGGRRRGGEEAGKGLRRRCEADKIEEITDHVGERRRDDAQERQTAAWQTDQPIAAKADDSEVSGHHLGAGARSKSSRVVDENPANLNDYGLSNPRIEVDFKAAGDKDYRKLLIGEKSPTGGDLFAEAQRREDASS